MRTLVTGATGLIGSHIVRALVQTGHEVRCLVRATSQRGLLDDLPVTWVVGDLLSTDLNLELACEGCDVVFHTAARFSYGSSQQDELHKLAVTGTETLLHACARQRVKTVVITSSSVVFGCRDDGSVISETTELASSDCEPAYVAAKIAQHRSSAKLGAMLDMDVRFACPTMTIGPATARLGPSNALIVAYLADPFGCTFPGGCNIVSTHDIAVGHLLVAKNGRAGESYLLGSENLTWRQFHNLVAELAGVARPRAELPHSWAFLAATAEEIRATISRRQALSTREQTTMLGRYYWYSHRKVAELGYSPRPARDALIETISWLAASPHITREMRTCMRLSPEIYRFRSAAMETPR